ncbi:ATP-binding cassette domain-containing protein [Kutzneria viridogrisea]|uniref:ABC transporter ATP-binding protein n=2 Tax=Kutzneria TaxID=43356 RepID=W5W2K2_9PSEU|nr:ATP-binding cassette domain-containing protein [Kutzneria albida]AHH94711.1 ABC transporter ATP-binding protein [Kutzneria albida DSM 43870]MBA8930379.1 ABC-type glutathione transport system ATPase component [Kutzneria viridogrisea]
MLEARGVVAGYQRSSPVVRGVDLALEPGRALGLLGPSGCGKSTLARVMSLLHSPYQGSVTVDGKLANGFRFRAPRGLRTRIGVAFQQPRLAVDPRLRLIDVIAEPLRATGQSALVERRVPELVERTGLTEDLLRRRPHQVSDGQLQRACLGRMLVLRPAYLICDEVTAMLDASTAAFLVGAIEEYRQDTGAAVLAISHDPVLLGRWCEQVLDFPGLNARADTG